MVDIRPNQLPDAILPLREADELIVDQGVDGVRKAPPSEAVNSVAPVASQAEAVAGADNVKRMTALRTKQSIASEVGVTLASSAQGAKADSAVQSVNGKTGNSVTLVKGDVGLGNVDNTSDLDKPISTATQTALNAKANSSVTISAGAGLDGGGNLSSNRTVSLNPASIASLAKADSAVQSVNGVFPVSGNVTVAAEEKRLQNTIATAIAESFPINVQFVETSGYSSVGDGGGALYKRVGSEPAHPGKFQSADGAWWEIVGNSIDIRCFGAKCDGVTLDNQAIENCRLYLASKGGGDILYPIGTVLVGYQKDYTGPGLGIQRMAIQLTDGIRHIGSGKYGTTVKLADQQNCHVFYGDGITSASTIDIGVDGNRTNQTLQNPSTGNDYCGVIVTGTVTNVVCRGMFVRNTCDYGIGFEGAMTARGCIVDDIHFKNTGADAFDSKGTGNCFGNFVTNIYVDGINPTPGQDGYQAGVNPREGWTVNNIVVGDLYGDQCAVRLNGDDTALELYGNVSNVVALGRTGETGTFAVMADASGVTFSNIYSKQVGTTVLCRGRENTFSNIFGLTSVTLVRLDKTSTGPAPERNLFSNLVSRGCTGYSVVVTGDANFNRFTNLIMRSGVSGIQIASGAQGNSFVGGAYQVMSGTALSNSGTNTIIRNISGIATSLVGRTAPVSTASTGVQTVTMPHGLVAAPPIESVQLSLSGISGNSVGLGNYYVVSTDATNINIAVNVVTAAAGGSLRFNVLASTLSG